MMVFLPTFKTGSFTDSKTYDSLITAFQELLQEKSFEQITVKELCSRARTRTATFYSHFDDKYDFFFFMVKELRRSFADSADIVCDKNSEVDYYTQFLQCGMNYLEKNEKQANSIRSSSMLVGMFHLMQDDMTHKLQEHLKRDSNFYDILNHPEIMVQFLIGGMNQVTEWWFTQKKTINKEDILEDTKVLVSNMLGKS